MTALLLLAALLPRATVDFESKAASVGAILEQLSAQTGTKLKASSKVGQEILFISAKDVELAELKKRIARATDAVWIKESDAEYLVRTPAEDRKVWAKHISIRKKLVPEALADAKERLSIPFDAKKLADELAALPSEADVRGDEARARARQLAYKELTANGALNRLLKRLILACAPEDLAAVDSYERHIFAIEPTRAQKGIDRKKAVAALSEFALEQQAWIDAASATGVPENFVRNASDPRTQLDVSPSLPGGVLLEVKRGDMAALMIVNLIGHKPPLGRRVLAQEVLADPVRRFLDQGPVAPDKDDIAVDLSADSKLFLDRMGSQASEPLSPRLLEILLHPDLEEPLGLAPSDALHGYSKLVGKNIVAAVPDMAAFAGWYTSPGQPVRVKVMINALVKAGMIEITDEPGWQVIAPTDRHDMSASFTPRGPIAELMQAIQKKRALDLRDYARYAFRSKRVGRFGLGEVLVGMVDRSLLSAVDQTDWRGLQLYGSFTREQQDALESGSRFSFQGLNPEQRRIVERIVFADLIRSEMYRPDQSGFTYQGQPLEPTEAFANGLPNEGAVSAKTSTTVSLMAYGKGSDGKIRPLRTISPSSIAYVEGDAVLAAQFGLTGLIGYAPSKEKMIGLKIELGPGIWKELPLRTTESDPAASPVRWQQLPDPFPAQIKQAIEAYQMQKAQEAKKNIPPRS